MKKSTIAFGAVLSAFVLFASESVWKGGSSGEWNNPDNWSAGVPNAADAIAVINATGNTSITLVSDVTAGGIKVTGAFEVVIGGQKTITLSSASKEVFTDVGEGATLVMDNVLTCAKNSGTTFVKKGKGYHRQGTSTSTSSDGTKMYLSNYSKVDVAGGVLELKFREHSNGLSSSDVVIRSGAKLVKTSANAIADDCKIHIEKDGIFDGGLCQDCIGGFTGAGVATNLSMFVSFPVDKGPFRFDGRLHGVFEIRPSPYPAQGELKDRRFIVGARDTLKYCTLNFCDEVYEDIPDILQFAPDAGGVFEVKIIEVRQYKVEIPRTWTIKLTDTEGKPVEIIVDGRNGLFARGTIAGKGSVTHKSSEEWTVTNGMLKAEGTLTAMSEACISLGNYDAACDGDITSFSKMVLEKNSIFNHKNVAYTLYPMNITGDGGFYFYDKAKIAFDDLSMTNGMLKFQGGSAAEVTFNGGCSSNLDFDVVYNTNGVVKINGGDFTFKNVISGEANKKWIQTGGTVRSTYPVSGYGSKNVEGTSDVFYYISGGELHSSTANSYGRGLGLEASGDAKVYLTSDYDKYYYHRVSSDGLSYTLRIKDSALVSGDGLHFASGSPETEKPYSSVLDLQGGELRLTGGFELLGKDSDYPTYSGTIYFNGGLLHSVMNERLDLRNWKFKGLVSGIVQERGARIKTSSDKVMSVLSFGPSLVSGTVAPAKDGGLSKYGRGILEIPSNCSYNGDTYIGPGGGLQFPVKNADFSPCGPGSVTLDNGFILTLDESKTVSYATGEGSKFSFGGTSMIAFNKTGSAVLGNAGAAANSVLARNGTGILLLGSYYTRNAVMGTGMKVKVNGGIDCDADTKLPAVPVFQYARPASGEVHHLRALTYSDADGFVAIPEVEGFDGGANSFAAIKSSTAYTLDSDRQVAGLKMEYLASDKKSANKGLTIAAGATLKIGNDKGYAPLILNNHLVNVKNPSQSIEGGGSIDFGKAQGIIISSAGQYYDNWYKTANINCVLEGSGGIVFSGGPASNYRVDILLDNANTFTGGAMIQYCTVLPKRNGALGSGVVTVLGNEDMGGGIWIKSDSAMTEIANPLVLSGNGRYYYSYTLENVDTPDYGALRADRSVQVKGSAEIKGNTRLTANGNTTTFEFAGGISGSGDLTLAGNGTVLFSSANTYEGKTIVEGILEVDGAGSFGTGDIELKKGATLRFSNVAAKTVPNNISGEGRIVFAGTGKVDFTGKVDVESDFTAQGSLSGAVSFVKDDDGVLYVTSTNTYTGGTEINAGTVVLGYDTVPDAAPFADSIKVRLDASVEDSLTVTENGGVLEWRDADGRDVAYSQSADKPELQPTLRKGIIGPSANSVFFTGGINRLSTTSQLNIKSVFAVYKIPTSGNPPNSSGWVCMGLMGFDLRDKGIRFENGTYEWGSTHWLTDAQVWLNGVRKRKSPRDTPCVASFMMTVENPAVTAIGDYWGDSRYPRGFWGDIAELLVYDRRFSDEERKHVEAYLAGKWGIDAGQGTDAKFADLLPPESDVGVAEGAAIDLNGADQAFESLSGEGSILNTSSVASTMTLAAGAIDGFTGSIGANIVLKITGNVTIPQGVLIDPGVDLVLANGVVLDLDGATVTVTNVSGSGSVRNGQLIVLGEDNLHSPGTTIIIR